MVKSRNKSLQTTYREQAIEMVRRNVTVYRRIGEKTVAALELQAPFLGITKRRCHSLFFRADEPLVLLKEWLSILRGSVELRRTIAMKLHDMADRLDEEADELELQQRQLSLWGEAECQSSGCVGLRKCAA